MGPEDLDPETEAEADKLFANQPPPPPKIGKNKKEENPTPSKGSGDGFSASGSESPLKGIKQMLKDETEIDMLNDLKSQRDSQRAMAQIRAAQMGQIQANPNVISMPTNQPQVQQPQPLPIPMAIPIGPDGKPDTQMATTMAAIQANPQLAMLFLMPQLMGQMGGNKGSGTNDIVQAMQAVNAIKGEAPNEVEKMTAQLQFMKGIMEMGNINRPAQGGTSDTAAMMSFLAQMMQQQNQITQQAAQVQLAAMQREVEMYKSQAQAQASQDPLSYFEQVERVMGAMHKISGLGNPQSQSPDTLIALKRLELDMAKEARAQQSEDATRMGWQQTIKDIGAKLTEGLSGQFGQQIGEGVKNSLEAAAQAQFQGRAPLAPGPIVQIPQQPIAPPPSYFQQPQQPQQPQQSVAPVPTQPFSPPVSPPEMTPSTAVPMPPVGRTLQRLI